MSASSSSVCTLPAHAAAPQRLHLTPAALLLPLHNVAATRRLEQQHMALLPPHALMRRAGLAIARLALALAPHARTIWVVCGAGNNGGDGLQAAALLKAWGKRVVVSLLGDPDRMPADAAAAWQQALQAGIAPVPDIPALDAQDLCIDALLGIGAAHAPSEAMCRLVAAMQQSGAPILSVDVPTGLHADTGAWLADASAADGVRASHTLTLLTLKPGLFTAHGRDAAGHIWWHGLSLAHSPATLGDSATAWLAGAGIQPAPSPAPALNLPHASHKGSFGDVWVLGGATGMQGAAVLAGTAALQGGAGRVHLLLPDSAAPAAMPAALMARTVHTPQDLAALPLAQGTTLAGCGGGQAIAPLLPHVLRVCPRLVLDADGLNALAQSGTLQDMLRQRASQGRITVLTPHPLEAARLLQCDAAAIQANRLEAAQRLADGLQCIVILKGSGSVAALPQQAMPAANVACALHYAGNARLATAGTGDVLAGCITAWWEQAQRSTPAIEGADTTHAWHIAFQAASMAVHAHGCCANAWHSVRTLTADALAQEIPRFRPLPAV